MNVLIYQGSESERRGLLCGGYSVKSQFEICGQESPERCLPFYRLLIYDL